MLILDGIGFFEEPNFNNGKPCKIPDLSAQIEINKKSSYLKQIEFSKDKGAEFWKNMIYL